MKTEMENKEQLLLDAEMVLKKTGLTPSELMGERDYLLESILMIKKKIDIKKSCDSATMSDYFINGIIDQTMIYLKIGKPKK